MKKKSILIVCISALMALAMFVGCDNAPVVPSWPNGGTLVQKVDLIEGQIIPTDAFDAVVTYTDGTKKTFANVAVTGTSGVAQNGETVSVEVGYDYQGKTVKATGDVVAIPVDHIEVTLAEGAELVYKATDDNGKITYKAEPVSKRDVIVNAVTADGLSYKVSEADFTVPTLDTITSDDVDDEAETVTVTLTVTALGTAKNDFSDEIEVVAGIDRAPAKPFYTVSSSTSFAIAPFAYGEDEMPEITFEAAKVKGFYGDSTEGSPVAVTEDPGLEFSGLLDARTKLPIGTTDLTKVNAEDLTFAITYADNQPVYGKVEYIPVTVEVTYEGEGVYVGEALPAADQFKVLVSIGGVFEEITPVDEDFVFYVQDAEETTGWAEYKEETLPEDGVYVHYVYKGIPSTTPAYVNDKADTVVQSIGLKLKETAVGPAKQILTNAPVFDVNNVEYVSITTKTGEETETTIVKAPFEGITFSYSSTTSVVTPLKDGVDLSAAESVYVIASYEGKVDTQTLATSTPKAVNEVVLSTNDYDTAVGSDVEWTIALVNDDGIVSYLHKDSYDNPAYKVWLDGNTTDVSLPAEVTAENQGPYYVTYKGLESNRVTVNAGGGYVTPTEDGFVVALKSAVKPMIGNPVSGNEQEYEVVASSWTPSDSGEVVAPSVYSIRKEATDQKYEASSTVYAKVSYVDSTGKTVITDEIAVEIKGVAWTEEESIKLFNIAAPEIAEGNTYTDSSYTYGQFGASGTQHGTDSYLCVVGWYTGEWDETEASLQKTDVTAYGWDRIVNFVVRYTNASGDIDYAIFPLSNVTRPAAN